VNFWTGQKSRASESIEEAPIVAGVFELIEAASNSPDDFDLRPLANAAAVPEDQQKVVHDAYEARNILKLLKAHDVFIQDDVSYDEFIARIRQAARAGCIVRMLTPAWQFPP